MASQQGTVDYICGQISGAGHISARKMFGEYGVYCDQKFIGTICNDTLFLKVTSAAQAFAPALELAPAYEGARPGFRIPPDVLDDTDRMVSLVKVVHDSLPAKKTQTRNP